MPPNANVFVHYGPYRACEIVEHRTDRLAGLKCMLSQDGHNVELVKSEDWNKVKLFVNGELVYKCVIQDLQYDGDGDLDPLCHEALQAVRIAF